MDTNENKRPGLTNIHHFALTVTDVEKSVAWYGRVLGLQRLPAPFPHHEAEDQGFGVLMVESTLGFGIGLHHHDANVGEPANEGRTGLDHFALGVPTRQELDTWVAWFDQAGVEHSGVTDMTEPMPYSVVVFRDPDAIQLELVHIPD